MAIAVETSATYTGATPSVTIGASGSDRVIAIFLNTNQIPPGDLTDITLNGVSADEFFALSVDGGRSAIGGFGIFREASSPGAGSFTVAATATATLNRHVYLVIELSGVDQTTATSTPASNTATVQADGSNIAATLAGQTGEYVLSYCAISDPVSESASGGLDPSVNLSEIIEGVLSGSGVRIAVAEDTSAASASEQYDWDVSMDGSTTIDAVVTGSFAVFAAAAAAGRIMSSLTNHGGLAGMGGLAGTGGGLAG